MAVAVFTDVGVNTTVDVFVTVTVGVSTSSVMVVGVSDWGVTEGSVEIAERGAKLYDLLVQPAIMVKPINMIPIQTAKNLYFFIISLLEGRARSFHFFRHPFWVH